MNAKQFLSISAAVLMAPVFAQTVPAEQWVGAPIQTAGTFSRDAVVADYVAAARAEAAAPQEFRVGPVDARGGAMNSAEVAADLNLWIRSGMRDAASREDFDPSAPAFRSQLSTYRKLRGGPAFIAEIRRIKGSNVEVTTSALAGEDDSGSN
ncbi:MAG: hypothetical protein WKG52_14500 [Variovorax sp.]